jgi:hypothetical protein
MHRALTNLERTQSAPQARNAGRWFLTLLGLSLALIGGLFVWLMGRSFLRAYEMRGWPEVECVILSSRMEDRRHDEFSAMEYRQVVNYGYVWKGEPRTGDKVTLRGSPWSSKPDVVEKRSSEWPIGMKTTCRVNPKDPSLAVLKPDSLAPGYSIWFPSLFVIGGLVISARALKSRSSVPN